MKCDFEFVDRNKNPVPLTKERQQEMLVEKIDRAMEMAGFRRFQSTFPQRERQGPDRGD